MQDAIPTIIVALFTLISRCNQHRFLFFLLMPPMDWLSIKASKSRSNQYTYPIQIIAALLTLIFRTELLLSWFRICLQRLPIHSLWKTVGQTFPINLLQSANIEQALLTIMLRIELLPCCVHFSLERQPMNLLWTISIKADFNNITDMT